MNRKVLIVALMSMMCISLLTGCSGKKDENSLAPDQTATTIETSDTSTDAESATDVADTTANEENETNDTDAVTTPVNSEETYSNEIYSVKYDSEYTDVKEWDMDDSVSFQVTLDDMHNYVNIKHITQYTYFDYKRDIRNICARNYTDFHEWDEPFGSQAIKACFMEYGETDTDKFKVVMVPVKNGVVVIEINHHKYDDTSMFTDKKPEDVIKEILDTFEINTSYKPADTDYTLSLCVGNPVVAGSNLVNAEVNDDSSTEDTDETVVETKNTNAPDEKYLIEHYEQCKTFQGYKIISKSKTAKDKRVFIEMDAADYRTVYGHIGDGLDVNDDESPYEIDEQISKNEKLVESSGYNAMLIINEDGTYYWSDKE